MVRTAAAAALALLVAGPAAAAPLAFRIDEGRNLNAFFRDGEVAAHLLLRSGTDPRILVAFPAGNSAVGLWFEPAATTAWTLGTAPVARIEPDARGRPLRGIVTTATVASATLTVRRAVVGSVRVLRDYQANAPIPGETAVAARIDGNTVIWTRDRLDGAPGYRLAVTVLNGRVEAAGTSIRLVAAAGQALQLRIVALTGETPLEPLATEALLTAEAGDDPRARNALAFLSYSQKYLAGSWRFDTYFGRDTLMSVRLLMPVLRPVAVEDGIASVLARLAPDGQVAHEEDIGEYAVLRNAREGRGGAVPIYDYHMVDDDFMLAPVAASYLLDRADGRARAAAFLAGKRADGRTNGAALAENFAWVAGRTAAFAAAPGWSRLVALEEGRRTGQWRDSNEGLGEGRYAYDVNAVFVPAALRAIARFAASGMLAPYLQPRQATALAPTAAAARVWAERAPPLFRIDLAAVTAQAAVRGYAARAGVPAAPALGAVANGAHFEALSLDGAGRPVPIVNSDPGFMLLFGEPGAADLARIADAVAAPFPAGLMTDVGMLVANPAFADAATQRRFGATAYHGTVIWSWQQAVMAAGLARQRARTDLPAAVQARLQAVEAQLWRAIDAGAAVKTSELWSWSYAGGKYRVEPFGARGGDADESNAAQLWSTVFLGVRKPVR